MSPGLRDDDAGGKAFAHAPDIAAFRQADEQGGGGLTHFLAAILFQQGFEKGFVRRAQAFAEAPGKGGAFAGIEGR